MKKFLTLALSALLSFFSSTALEGTGYAVAIIVLAVLIDVKGKSKKN